MRRPLTHQAISRFVRAVSAIAIFFAASCPAQQPGSESDELALYKLRFGDAAPYGEGFTREEHAFFTEAPDRFPTLNLPKFPNGTNYYWLDDKHLLVSTLATPDGWDAQQSPPPDPALGPIRPARQDRRNVIYDIESGQISDAPYSAGSVDCYSMGQILISHWSPEAKSLEYFAGTYGKPLVKLERPEHTMLRFATASCSRVTYDGKHLLFPLLPDDGTLQVPSELNKRTDGTIKISLLGKDGGTIAVSEVSDDIYFLNLRYLPWLGQYLTTSTYVSGHGHAGALIARDGKVSYIDPDPFIKTMTQKYGGDSAVWPTRAGTFSNFVTEYPHAKMLGLYFRDNGRLLRIMDGNIALNLSPNGCRALVMQAVPTRKLGVRDFTHPTYKILELCKP